MFFSIMLAFTVLSCGGGGGGGGDTGTADDSSTTTTTTQVVVKQGEFIDSAVEGLYYVSGGQQGYTDANGTFSYEDGENVRFYIGDILIGEGAGDSVMTPIDLVPGATDDTNQSVINICRFLITLDEDADPDNGITISSAVFSSASGLSVDFSDEALVQAAVDALLSGRTLESVLDARNHFRNSLLQLYGNNVLQPYVGNYEGTYSASDGSAGAWKAVLNDEGLVTYTITPNSGSESTKTILVTGTGTLEFLTNGTVNYQVWVSGNTYTIFVAGNGDVDGTWVGTPRGSLTGTGL